MEGGAITYWAVGTGPAGASAVLCRISDEAGERHQLFGPRLEWTHVRPDDVDGQRREITAKRAGQIAVGLRRYASEGE